MRYNKLFYISFIFEHPFIYKNYNLFGHAENKMNQFFRFVWKITGSWLGTLDCWNIGENKRSFLWCDTRPEQRGSGWIQARRPCQQFVHCFHRDWGVHCVGVRARADWRLLWSQMDACCGTDIKTIAFWFHETIWCAKYC